MCSDGGVLMTLARVMAGAGLVSMHGGVRWGSDALCWKMPRGRVCADC